MRERTLRKQLVLGAMVAVVTAVVAPGVWLALRDAVDAVRAGDGSTATAQGVTALVLVAVPVLALAAYAHWLTATTRRRAGEGTEDTTSTGSTGSTGSTAGVGAKLLVGLLVLALLVVAWPATRWLALTAGDAWADGALTTAVPAALAVPAYLAFVVFCVVRYLRWLRRRSPARRGW